MEDEVSCDSPQAVDPPEKKGSFKTWVSILIALVAVSAALVSWTAARVNGQAGSLDSSALQAALDGANARMTVESDLTTNLGFYNDYYGNLQAASLIEQQITQNPTIAWMLEDQRLQAINRASFLQKQMDADYLIRGETFDTFQADRYRQARMSLEASKKEIDPTRLIGQSQETRRLALNLVSLNLLFMAAIFFFTTALNSDNWRRSIWAGVGIGLYSVGVMLFLVWTA